MNQEQLQRAADALGAVRAEMEAGSFMATRTESAYIAGAEHALRLALGSELRTRTPTAG